MKLENKVAIVTGGAQGIGRATVRKFLQEGAYVVICDVAMKEAQVFLEELESEFEYKGKVIFVKTDITNKEEIAQLVRTTLDTFGEINVLVNNAGVNIPGDILEIAEADWDLTMAVNIKGQYLLSKAVIPHMQKQGGGVIVNTASGNSFMAETRLAAYVTSKGAVKMQTQAMAVDFIKDNIRVNAVAPGWVDTKFNDDHANLVGGGRVKVLETLDTVQPIGAIRPEEIAKVILFLASDDSSCLVGTTIIADGGLMAGF